MLSLKKIVAEPLVHFLLIGLSIFLLHFLFNANQTVGEESTILIDDNDINRLIIQYKQVWDDTPDETTIQKLIQQYVESEITYREALAMNLDHNDEIIKRRLKQKYEFLVKDLITSVQPSDTELEAFYKDHIEQFQTEKLFSFAQYYFSPDKRQSALEDAKSFLTLQIRDNPNHVNKLRMTDQSHLHPYYSNASKHTIRQEFGIDFLHQIQSQASNTWLGPLSSGYGIHILYIDSIRQSTAIDFEDTIDEVRSSYEDELTKTYNRNLLNKVKDKYEIKYDLRKWKNLIE